jgi:hypothetical protein
MLLSALSILTYVFSSAAGNSDLTVTMVGSNSTSLYDGDKATLNAVVRNTGDDDVRTEFLVDFYMDGNLVQRLTSRAVVKAGGMAVISSTKTASLIFGNHKLTASINADKKLLETDYKNNSVKSRISVVDDFNPSPLPDPLPVEDDLIDLQPVSKYEAENCTLSGTLKKDSTNEGYSGTGYVTNIANVGDKISFKYNAPISGSYNIKVRYSNNQNVNKSLAFFLGDSIYVPVTFNKQEYKDSWNWITYTTNLSQGENNIVFGFSQGSKEGISIDRFEVERKISSSKVSSFKFKKALNPSLPADIDCKIENGNITATIANDIDISNLIASYETTYTSVKVQGVEQESGVTANNFVNGHYYTFSDATTTERFSVRLDRLENDNLPNLYVTLDESVTADQKHTLLWGYQAKDKDMELPAKFNLTVNNNTKLFGTDTTVGKLNTWKDSLGTIRLRGNSTLGAVKKPYKIKLDAKTAALDMPKSKHWILLASYDDKSFMRVYFGFELGKICNNMQYTTNYHMVNLFLDGSYNGLYLFGEQIKADQNRLNITQMKKTSTNITGGYILELDERRDDPQELRFEISWRKRTYPFTIKEPDEDEITPEMNEYIKNYITEFFGTLDNPQTHQYEQYIDVDSFVDWYIVMELAKVNDASGYSSVYLNKNANGKLCMGPVWDFNPGAGNVNYNGAMEGGQIKPGAVADTTGFWIRDSIWWHQLFKDSKFEDRVKARWQELYNTKFADFLEDIDAFEEYITPAANDNFKKWDCLSTYVWAQPKILHTYSAEVDFYRRWMQYRISWLNQQYGESSGDIGEF